MRTKTFLSSTKALTAGLIAFAATALHAQVGINNTGATPNASAILDLQTGNAGVNKGFLPQAVALTATNSAAPITTPATGLIVYNTATAGSSPNNVVPGYYYWNGSEWLGMGAPTMGTGTVNYVARWTPNGNTLGTGVIQDDGTEVGVNSAPVAGYEVYVSSATGSGIYGITTSTATSGVVGVGDSAVSGYGDAANIGIGVTAVSPANDGMYSNGYWGGVYGAGSYLYGVWGQDALGDVAQLGWNDGGAYGYGVNSYGVNYGGVFADPSGDFADLGDNGNEYGVDAYGFNDGGYFYSYAYDAGTTSYDLLDQAWVGDGVSDCGGYFEDGEGDYVYDAYAGSSNSGSGPKNTIVQDENGTNHMMTCTEAPEVLFQDYGTSHLVGGRVHINLDEIFAHTVTINEKHPLRVMVTLNDQCNGVFVTNRTLTGFDVVELNNGASNALFTYEVVANRADSKTYKGVQRHYADLRYQAAPGPLGQPKKPGVRAEHGTVSPVRNGSTKASPVKNGSNGPTQNKN